ncbi:MAG: hypothetical protein Q8922_00710 [Bacteroidota bacterium]|nr:hypothetical protein [Bacteroidota bacterium]MDP4232553.1 hypothetical protein [Bacteroidota bacterium]MDP4242992.1 hypothetical protein [Bacteroidota bacterium]MDP4286433.1 hypothetical protein [Bacteroidota bacterium]
MNKYRSVSFALLVAFGSFFISSCAERSQMPQHAFEGTIVEVISVPGVANLAGAAMDSGNEENLGTSLLGALSNVTITMHVRGDKVASNVAILGGMISMTSIIDRNARTLTMLLPNHTAVVQNLREFDSARHTVDDSLRVRPALLDSLASLMPQPTGRHETIQGVEADEYHAAKGDMEITAWLSSNEKVKAFEVLRDALLGRGGRGEGGLDQVLALIQPVAGKIPVRFETKLKGKTFAKGEMQEITEEKLDDAIFEIPKGYKIENADSVRTARQSEQTDTTPHRHFTAP